MTSSQRIIINTAAQYTRTVLNVCLSLYSTRLILAALGQSDYGIFNVVGGVVAMLSFITGALVTTTQRYLSFYHGAKQEDKVYSIFGNSILLHLLIGLSLVFLLSVGARWITHSYLNIEDSRDNAAMVVYFASLFMLFLSFITAPYRALFIARENIVYISIVDVLDGIFRVILAIWLTHISYDRLITYSCLLPCINIFNLLAFGLYAVSHFKECHWVRLKEWDNEYIKQLSGFAGWTIYSTGCIIARTQGLAIILNRFINTVVNAAYGIALHVTSAINFVAQSVTNAINPQIMKAEGSGNRERMIILAESASKYASLLIAMVAIPIIAEMDAILHWWLTDVPEGANMFCRFVLAASVCDQLTIGLGSANQAIGKIRNYSIIVNTVKVLTLPAAWICLKCGLPVTSTMLCYIGFELLCAMIRLPFLKYTAGISIRHFAKNVFLPLLCPYIIMASTSWLIISYVDISYRFVLTLITTAIAGAIVIWFTALTKTERQIAIKMISDKIK
ncbi:MAG: hypothetical protein MJZ53_01820 [Paludibacteraceae bacterium]|nr:hypothetical protein [Paludibacteraceae bacterium]